MSKEVEKCLKHFKIIRNLPPISIKKALSNLLCNSCYLKTIKEIAKNIVNKNIKPVDTNVLKKHWKNIVDITNIDKKRKSKKFKKKLYMQSGGWLWSVIPVVLSLFDLIKNGQN
jgi:hypothetical protein